MLKTAAPLLLSAALGIAAPALPMAAEAAAAAANQAEDGLPKDVVDAAIASIRETYVIEARTDEIVSALQTALDGGRYDGLEGDALATAVSEDLLAASNDKHLYMDYDPEAAAAMEEEEAGGGEGGADFFLEWARSTNNGLVEMAVLDGNVRYVKIAPFLWDDETGPAAYEGAMRFLGGGDAMIIDLAHNGGGSPDAVRELVSHFLPVGTELMTFHMGPSGEELSAVEKTPAAGRIDGPPLYVLVSGRSASAAEEAASHFKHFGLATLVGETTAGAGHRNELNPLPHGFTMSVSTGRAIHAVTGEGWEGTGVAPDVEAAKADAKNTAHRLALLALAEENPDEAATYLQSAEKLATPEG